MFACVLFPVVLAVGVKESSRFNNIFTMVNLLVVTYIVICGSFKADTANWNIDPEQVRLKVIEICYITIAMVLELLYLYLYWTVLGSMLY